MLAAILAIYPRLEEDMIRLAKTSDKHVRLAPTLALVAVVLLTLWMGTLGGCYFVSGWAPVALVLATLALIASLVGVLRDTGSWRDNAALGLFAAYTVWTFAVLL